MGKIRLRGDFVRTGSFAGWFHEWWREKIAKIFNEPMHTSAHDPLNIGGSERETFLKLTDQRIIYCLYRKTSRYLYWENNERSKPFPCEITLRCRLTWVLWRVRRIHLLVNRKHLSAKQRDQCSARIATVYQLAVASRCDNEFDVFWTQNGWNQRIQFLFALIYHLNQHTERERMVENEKILILLIERM